MITPHEFQPSSPFMNGKQLAAIISNLSNDQITCEGPMIHFSVDGTSLLCVFDETHDRIRVICPVIAIDQVPPAQRDAVMEANFHSALDARYAVSGGTLYSAFIHPLSSLTERDLISGISQTQHLAATFGTDYTSGTLHFGG